MLTNCYENVLAIQERKQWHVDRRKLKKKEIKERRKRSGIGEEERQHRDAGRLKSEAS